MTNVVKDEEIITFKEGYLKSCKEAKEIKSEILKNLNGIINKLSEASKIGDDIVTLAGKSKSIDINIRERMPHYSALEKIKAANYIYSESRNKINNYEIDDSTEKVNFLVAQKFGGF